MQPHEVCHPPIPQMWDVRTLLGISVLFCLPTHLIQMVDPPGSLEYWGR